MAEVNLNHAVPPLLIFRERIKKRAEKTHIKRKNVGKKSRDNWTVPVFVTDFLCLLERKRKEYTKLKCVKNKCHFSHSSDAKNHVEADALQKDLKRILPSGGSAL